MNKINYEKEITEAKDKGELIGVIIAFSQDTSLPWATFRKYYNQAHLRMLTEFKEEYTPRYNAKTTEKSVVFWYARRESNSQ